MTGLKTESRLKHEINRTENTGAITAGGYSSTRSAAVDSTIPTIIVDQPTICVLTTTPTTTQENMVAELGCPERSTAKQGRIKGHSLHGGKGHHLIIG